MITHFQLKEIKNNMINQEWEFTFFYKKNKYKGKYFKNGEITWIHPSSITTEDKTFLESCVHDLMLYHVYEDHS
ncbi:hypothetical protein CR203_00205 [Salipaludibacillus neizhouensis]|uniref:YheE family protein n=1 Tax=Salipaludibacillus neizhouensis TaxID=885475 RepID=A0A3A9K7I4_9BACI|nr:DUF5342 family protein [Salipaludibacillus neizhouensis]RKL68517.1 hypothetical protein CR203_00205 [Salipaludibacillus neizhouensis]